MTGTITNYKIHVVRATEEIPSFLTLDDLAEFLYQNMEPYQDEIADIKRGISDALSKEPGKGGFVLVAEKYGMPLGALVMLRTGMGGYVPENLLLFVAVHVSSRNLGIGGDLIRHAIKFCEGDIKLHVEYDNPAQQLYERLGFTSKYAEMRYHHESP